MFGANLFKWISFAVNVLRLLGQIFGDDEDAKAVSESEARTEDPDVKKVC